MACWCGPGDDTRRSWLQIEQFRCEPGLESRLVFANRRCGALDDLAGAAVYSARAGRVTWSLLFATESQVEVQQFVRVRAYRALEEASRRAGGTLDFASVLAAVQSVGFEYLSDDVCP
jgi:hypothetical protein